MALLFTSLTVAKPHPLSSTSLRDFFDNYFTRNRHATVLQYFLWLHGELFCTPTSETKAEILLKRFADALPARAEALEYMTGTLVAVSSVASILLHRCSCVDLWKAQGFGERQEATIG